ncbi:MAG: iron-containing alcohol dehydrogenase family protein [Alphaproteobacteria bacterium]
MSGSQAFSKPFEFNHATARMIVAPGALERLAELAKGSGARRAALVIDGFFAGGPVEQRLRGILDPVLAAPAIVHRVPNHEPDTASVEECRAALVAADADMIVALGGGSALDTAKVARMLLSNPGPAEDIAGFGLVMQPHPSLLVCVPTTAGTGSEVSLSAVIGREGSNAKLIYNAGEMCAGVAILDAELSTSAPPQVTAAAGYDAITHAVEAYVSNFASPMTDPMAASAMKLLAQYLPIAYREPDNLQARAGCLVASAQAAIAFNSANLGLAHAISGPLGAMFHVAHGLANAIVLPAVAAYNEACIGAKGEFIARIFGGPTVSAGLARLRCELGLDVGLDDFVTDGEGREALAQAAMKSGQVGMNPRPATIEHMRAILAASRTPTGGEPPALDI